MVREVREVLTKIFNATSPPKERRKCGTKELKTELTDLKRMAYRVSRKHQRANKSERRAELLIEYYQIKHNCDKHIDST